MSHVDAISRVRRCGRCSVTLLYHILRTAKMLIRQLTCLYKSNVLIYVAYVVTPYAVMVGRYGITVSL